MTFKILASNSFVTSTLKKPSWNYIPSRVNSIYHRRKFRPTQRDFTDCLMNGENSLYHRRPNKSSEPVNDLLQQAPILALNGKRSYYVAKIINIFFITRA